MAYRPKIGITMRLEHETRRFYLGRDYAEAIEAAGGTPIHIALIPKEEFVRDVVADLDGILLSGSASDMDPAYWNEDPHPKIGRVVPEKDQTDLLVLAEAEKRALPVFGICFGMQSLNVSRGGSLLQDIEMEIEDPVQHQQGIPRELNSHSIRIKAGSLLEKALGVGSLTSKVNSHHHQAIRNVGKNLRPTAWANDGVIEAVEDTRDDRFVLGVQWHPELSWASEPLSESLFRIFTAECSIRTDARTQVA